MEIIVFTAMMTAVVLFLGIVFLYADFLTWIVSGERTFDGFRRFSDILIIAVAIVFLIFNYSCSGKMNDEWPVPVPTTGLSFYLLIFGFIFAYLYSTIRQRLGPALLEIGVTWLMIYAIPFITICGILEHQILCWIFCIIPLNLVVIMTLAGNFRLTREGLRTLAPP